MFKKYKLHKTDQHNCVLILLITSTREFLVYGDQGIHEKVGRHFWEEARNGMLNMFKENRIGDGLCNATHLIGERLAQYFPYLETPNESIEAFATALFNTYGIGNMPKNNGVLLLVAVRDRKARIELGSG